MMDDAIKKLAKEAAYISNADTEIAEALEHTLRAHASMRKTRAQLNSILLVKNEIIKVQTSLKSCFDRILRQIAEMLRLEESPPE